MCSYDIKMEGGRGERWGIEGGRWKDYVAGLRGTFGGREGEGKKGGMKDWMGGKDRRRNARRKKMRQRENEIERTKEREREREREIERERDSHVYGLRPVVMSGRVPW